MTSDNVGYGKPPRHSQFQAGKSGNPKGRPQGRLSMTRLIEKYLDAKVVVTVGDVKKTMTRREALVISFVGDALKGKDRVRKQLLDLLLIIDTQKAADTPEAVNTAEHDAVIMRYLNRSELGSKPKSSEELAPAKAKIIKKIKSIIPNAPEVSK